ncbi:MAG: DUF2934 domain-containing protein [Gallionellaceae bacterium]
MAKMISKVTSPTGRSDSVNAWNISPEARQRMIDEAAYYRHVQRGFAPGHDLDDWLAAEADFERANLMRQPPEADTTEEFGMQHGGTLGPAEDEALKRIIRGHPRRDIPRIESMEPEDAPPKE